MSQGFLVAIALLMMAAGIGFIYLILGGRRPFRPRDPFEWIGSGLSSLLVLSAAMLLVLTLGYKPPVPMPTAASQTSDVPAIPATEFDRPARDFEFRLVGDDGVSNISSFRGKVVLLNFWATWCAPCLMEIPDLNRLQDAYRDRGLVVVSVSDEPRQDLLTFMENRPMTTVSAYLPDPTTLPEPYLQTLPVRPTTYVIDRKGDLKSYVVGAGTFASFEEMLKPYL